MEKTNTLIVSEKRVLINAADYELVRRYKWHVNDAGYVVWRGIKNGKKQTVRMHRLILDAPDGMVIDHINHNKLDNRRSNLRIVTQKENMRNLSSPGKGYWYQRQNKNWVVEIFGKHRGTFRTESEAADFAALVRAGLADTKPKPIRTECTKGHTLEDAYMTSKGARRCRTCHRLVRQKYNAKIRGMVRNV